MLKPEPKKKKVALERIFLKTGQEEEEIISFGKHSIREQTFTHIRQRDKKKRIFMIVEGLGDNKLIPIFSA